MKISDRVPAFLKQPPYFTNPFYLWVKSELPPPFLETFKNLTLTPVYKGGEFQLWTVC